MRLFKRRKERGEEEERGRECQHEWDVDVIDSEKCAVCGQTVLVLKRKRCKRCGKTDGGWEEVTEYLIEGRDKYGNIYICAECYPKFRNLERMLEHMLGPTPAYDFHLAYMGTPIVFWSLASLREWLSKYIAYRSKITKVYNSHEFGNTTGYVFDAIPKDPLARPYLVMLPLRVLAWEAGKREG